MPGDLLPLFPLHTVLFPRMPLPLHVFESRYVEMVNRCIREGRPFGVALIRDGDEVGDPAIPENIGTLAKIQAVEPLPEGGMNILAVGLERFRLLDCAQGVEPYLVGMVEPLHDNEQPLSVLAPLVAEVTALFHGYFQALITQAGVEMPEYELPIDPEELSFVIAAVLQIDAAQRQEFLEMTDTASRLEQQRDILARETERINGMRERTSIELNPLDAERAKEYFSRN